MGKIIYKGKPYKLLWQGQTKYGQRAHLAFCDGSKDFWVDAGLVASGEGDASGEGEDEMCAECGERRGVRDAPDSSGIVALVCERCARLPRWGRSYA